MKTFFAIVTLAAIPSLLGVNGTLTLKANSVDSALGVTSSLESGVFSSKQSVSLTAKNGGDIYYSLDGSFPTIKYSSAFEVGEDYSNSNYILNAIEKKEGKMSLPSKYTYTVNLENNVASKATASFTGESSDLLKLSDGSLAGDTIKTVNDGIYDTNGVSYPYGEYIVLALDKSYTVNRIDFSCYFDWAGIYGLEISLSDTADFASSKDIVKKGPAVGASTSKKTASGAYIFTFNFAPTTASFIRVTNAGNKANGSAGLSELQVFEGTSDNSFAPGENVLLGKIPTFTLADGSAAPGTETWPNGGADYGYDVLTDGTINSFRAIAIKNSEGSTSLSTGGFATFDFGAIASIDKVKMVLWHDWGFNTEIILSKTADFTSSASVYKVSDYSYAEDQTNGHTITFAATEARYMRVFSQSNHSGEALFEEFQAYVKEEETEPIGILPGNTVEPIEVKYGTSKEDVLSLLDTNITFNLTNGETLPFIAAYTCATYNPNVSGTYEFVYKPTGYDTTKYVNPYDVSLVYKVSVAAKADYSALQAKIDETIVETSYTSSSVASYKSLVNKAKEMIAADDSTQEDIDSLLASLNSALVLLPDASTLTARLGEVKLIAGSTYTKSSYAKLTLAISNADEEIAARDYSSKDVVRLLASINEAVSNLLARGNDTIAKALITEMKNVDTSSFTTKSRCLFEDALSLLESMVTEEDSTQEQLDAQVQVLKEAKESLTKKGDKSALSILLAEEVKQADYTALSYANYLSVKNEANKVYESDNASQDEVDDAISALKEAKANLLKKGDKSSLQKVLSKTVVPELYTKATYAAYLVALDEAKAVVAKEDPSKDEVDSATTKLNAAIDGLALVGNKNLILSKLEEVKGANVALGNKNDYESLQKAIKNAEIIAKSDEELSQEEVNAIVLELDEAYKAYISEKPLYIASYVMFGVGGAAIVAIASIYLIKFFKNRRSK